MLRTWEEVFYTDDATVSKRIFQPFICHRNVVVDRIRIGLVGVGDPDFESVFAEIYAYDTVKNVPTKLLHTSTTQIQKTSITTLGNFAKEMPLDFNSVALNGDTKYAMIVRFNGYTFNNNSFVGWRKDFPGPAYPTNNPALSMASVGTVSYWLRFIGDEF